MPSSDPPAMRAFRNEAGEESFLSAGLAIFPRGEREYVYENPHRIVIAWSIAEVMGALREIQRAVSDGAHAAGYIAYEAAPAFDSALAAHPSGAIPLLWFGLYEKPRVERLDPEGYRAGFQLSDWQPQVTEEEYFDAVARIKEHIAGGDSYQVNYTFPMRAAFKGDSLAWFRRLCAAQGGGYPAYLDLGRYKILSASPELFFEYANGRLVTRPMKGTCPRGKYNEEDELLRHKLKESEKDRAENVMIVDMLRNDMGRVSAFGSVRVKSLFDTERYNTVWQMTSTIESRYAAEIPEVLAALFPCGSVTGAPKIMTSRIIRDVEQHRRGVYCGAIGLWRPRKTRFTVGIRTVLLDTLKGAATYHVGSGVTWDSLPELEYRECMQKAALLSYSQPPFHLLETMRHENHAYAYLQEHLSRLEDSAAYFGYPVDFERVRKELDALSQQLPAAAHKVRLAVDSRGRIQLQHGPMKEERMLRVGLALEPVDSENVFLYHKTSQRDVYQRARESRPDCDDVLLVNERGELTESTIANIVLQINGQKYTPPRACGLLCGTFRRVLLERGEIQEQVLVPEDLHWAEKISLINSVRDWITVEWVH